MKITLAGTIVELGIDYDIIGHTHNGMLIDCAPGRLVFVEMPPEELRTMPLYSPVAVTVETPAAPQPAPPPTDDAKDATRYRFLRANRHFNSDRDRLEWYLPRAYLAGGTTLAQRLDESIDQAIQEQRR